MSYLTPTEAAELLKVDEEDLMSLVREGKLRAIQVGPHVRIRAAELERLETTSPAGPSPTRIEIDESGPAGEAPEGVRWVSTRTGRARFRVAGCVAEGAKIWPGRMRYPIKMPKRFMEELLDHFGSKEGDVPVGGKFDDPGKGSLGAYIQAQLEIKMNPAVYLAALLIDEGYAVEGERGKIAFTEKAKTAKKDDSAT